MFLAARVAQWAKLAGKNEESHCCFELRENCLFGKFGKKTVVAMVLQKW
jgi:hypothetical protein